MAKRLRTTPALAVVVVMLVGACASSTHVAERIRAERAAPARRAERAAERVRPSRSRSRARPRRRQLSRRSRPATPSWTRHSAPTSRSPARPVSIQTQWIGGEGKNFAAALADFATATGITIKVDSIGSSHETVLQDPHRGWQPPDLAMLAQPTRRPGVREGRQGHRRRDDHGCAKKLSD